MAHLIPSSCFGRFESTRSRRCRRPPIVCCETTKPTTRRSFILDAISAAAFLAPLDAKAVSSSRRALRAEQIPESEYKTLPNGLKYYDVKVGTGAPAEKGARVAVHYVAKWKDITFMTSRQGLGVTGGTPYGFDVGASEKGLVLKGLDLGVQGMRVGGEVSSIKMYQIANTSCSAAGTASVDRPTGAGLWKHRRSGNPTGLLAAERRTLKRKTESIRVSACFDLSSNNKYFWQDSSEAH